MLDLNIELAEVSTALPLLPAGDYHVGIKKAEVVESKNKPGNWNLKVGFGLKEKSATVTGEVVNPGFPLNRYYPLQQSETEGAPDFRRDLKLLFIAAFNIEDENQCPPITNDTIASLNGCELIASVKVEKAQGQYGESNSVAAVRRIG